MIIYSEQDKDVRIDKEVQSLKEKGFEVDVYSYKLDLENKPQKYKKIYLRKKNKLLRYYEFYRNLKEILLEDKPDIIHAHDLAALPVGFYIAKKTNAKFIFDAHELYHTLHNFKKIKKMILKIYLPKIDYLITVNESIENIYKKEFKAKRTLVLKNTPNFKIDEGNFKLRKELGIQKADKILLFQGYIVPHKGVEYLINLLDQLPKNYKLVYMGEVQEEYKQELLIEIDRKKCSNRIFFKDSVPYEKIFEYTGDADLGVYLPDIKEQNNFYSLPNKVFEYLASGLNIAVSDLPELKKLVETESVGIALGNDNSVKTNAKLIVDYMEGDNYKKNQKKHIFHWSNEEEKLIKLYSKLLEEKV